jgi:hypothetical protein
MLEVAEQVQSLLELECSGLGVGFRRGGIDLALAVTRTDGICASGVSNVLG